MLGFGPVSSRPIFGLPPRRIYPPHDGFHLPGERTPLQCPGEAPGAIHAVAETGWGVTGDAVGLHVWGTYEP